MAKYRKIKEPTTSRVYRYEAINLALGYCPAIFPCCKCKHPVIKGYCCTTCGNNNPEGY
jgi:hypothetical protein